jgi:hypothetical protein
MTSVLPAASAARTLTFQAATGFVSDISTVIKER